MTLGAAWEAESVKCPVLGFGSGRELMGRETEPRVALGSLGSSESAWDPLPLPLLLSLPTHTHALCLK